MNIKPVSENTMKQAEGEVGILIEEPAKESCENGGEKKTIEEKMQGGRSKGALITQGQVMAPWWNCKQGNASTTGQKIHTARNGLERKKQKFSVNCMTVSWTISVLLKQWKHQLQLIYVLKKSIKF